MRLPQCFATGSGRITGYRGLSIAMLVLLSAGQCLFAGTEFLAAAGEPVVPNQLIVGLQLGADVSQIVSSLVPQAAASLVSVKWNTYLFSLPSGIQASVSRLLAASPLVRF